MSTTKTETGRIIAIVNEKGGTGKTNTAISLAAAMAASGNENFSVLEIDSSNNSAKDLCKSELLAGKIESIDLEKSDDELAKAVFRTLTDDKTIILDCGASLDSKTMIKKIKALELDNVTWLIPIQNSLKQMQNLVSTYVAIRDADNTFVLKNQVLTKEGYTQNADDYIFFEGSKKYGTKSFRKELELSDDKIIEIPDSAMFELCEAGNETVYDVAKIAMELSPAEARKAFLSKGDEAYFVKMSAKYNVAQQSQLLVNRLVKEFERIL